MSVVAELLRETSPTLPAFAGALHGLDLLSSDDYEYLATRWMEAGHDSPALLDLAWPDGLNLSDMRGRFAVAMGELGIAPQSSRGAHYAAARETLQSLLRRPNAYMPRLRFLIELSHSIDETGERLFPRDALGLEGEAHEFAGERLGITQLYGLAYCHDDVREWTATMDAERRERVMDVARILLATLFQTEALPR